MKKLKFTTMTIFILSAQLFLPVTTLADSVSADSTSGIWGTVPWTYDANTDTVTLESGVGGSATVAPWANSHSTSTVSNVIFTGEIVLPEDSSYLFAGQRIKTVQGLNYLNTSNVINMNNMFYLSQLTDVDIASWNTSNVTTMSELFRASEINSLDVSTWDTSNVSNMGNLFNGAYRINSLSLLNWNTSSVTIMEGMFFKISSLTTLDLSTWNTSNVINMYGMFDNMLNLEQLNISNFDTSNVTEGNFFAMFSRTDNLSSLTLGENIKLNNSMYLADNLAKFATTTWRNIDTPYNQFTDSTDLMTNYNGSFPGTYVRDIIKNKQSISGSDYTMYVGDKDAATADFKASATDKDGNAIDVTADLSAVDFSKAGTHDVVLTAADGQTKTVKLIIKENKVTDAINKKPDNSNNPTTNNTPGKASGNNTSGKVTNTTASKNAGLPSTGEVTSTWLTIIGSMTLLASGTYVLNLKRKKNN